MRPSARLAWLAVVREHGVTVRQLFARGIPYKAAQHLVAGRSTPVGLVLARLPEHLVLAYTRSMRAQIEAAKTVAN